MKNYLFILLFLLLFITLSFAQPNEEEKYIRYPTAGRPEKIKQRKGKLRVSTLGLQGFDNNANLDSSRKGDSFQEAIVNVDYRYKYSQKTNIGAGFNFTGINYDRYTDNSFYDNILKLDWTRKLFKVFTFQKVYQLEYLYFPKDKNSSYLENDLGFSLRHHILKKLYHSFQYTFLTRNYSSRERRLGDRSYSDKKRFDYRNVIRYEIGHYFKKFFTKLGYQFYVNESNEIYRDYYDYYSNKGILSLGYNFTNKLSLYTGFGFEKRHYKDRRQIDGNDASERENIYMLNTSLMYKLTKSLSSILEYSYRETHSNVPNQKYSGSLTTIGLNYVF